MKRRALAHAEVVRIHVPLDFTGAGEMPQGSYGKISGMSTPERIAVYVYHLERVYVIDAVYLEPTGYRDNWYYMSAVDQEAMLDKPWQDRLVPIETDEDIVTEWTFPSEE